MPYTVSYVILHPYVMPINYHHSYACQSYEDKGVRLLAYMTVIHFCAIHINIIICSANK